jgi:hypothetical protein
VDFLDRPQQIKSKGIAVGLEQSLGPASQAVNHLRTSHFLRPAPGIEITIALEGYAMLFDAHVAHPHFLDELIDGESASPFELIENFKTLGASDFGE